MLPIILDASRVRIALIGKGPAANKREAMLAEAGASDVARLGADVPADTLDGFDIVYIADVPEDRARLLAEAARRSGAVVNVEDVNHLCDFHVPASVRRGDLLLTVSTGGKSPGLAVRLKRWIEGQLGPEWGGRLNRLAAERADWRRQGHGMAERLERTQTLIDREGWLR